MQPALLRSMRRDIFRVGSLQIVLTGTVIAACLLQGESWRITLFTSGTGRADLVTDHRP